VVTLIISYSGRGLFRLANGVRKYLSFFLTAVQDADGGIGKQAEDLSVCKETLIRCPPAQEKRKSLSVSRPKIPLPYLLLFVIDGGDRMLRMVRQVVSIFL
jgi:hypothetical protein